MSGKSLVVYSLGIKLMVLIFIVALVWGHGLISQRWFNPLASRNEILEELRDKSFPVDTRGQFGQTGLMIAIIDGDLGLVKAFLEHGASLDTHINDTADYRQGYMPLHLALDCFNERPDEKEIIKHMFEYAKKNNIPLKPIVDGKDTFGNRPVHLVLAIDNPSDRMEMFKLLCDYGADINAQNNDGNTMLHRTVGFHDMLWAGMILDAYSKEIDPSIKNNKGLTVPALAKKLGQGDMLELLCAKGPWSCTPNELEGLVWE